MRQVTTRHIVSMAVPMTMAVPMMAPVSMSLAMIMAKGRPFRVLVRQVNQMANAVKDRVANPDQAYQATQNPYALALPSFRFYCVAYWGKHAIS